MALPTNPQTSGGLAVQFGLPAAYPDAIEGYFLGKCKVEALTTSRPNKKASITDRQGYEIGFTLYDQQEELTATVLQYDGFVEPQNGDQMQINSLTYTFSDVEPVYSTTDHQKWKFKLTYLPRLAT